MNIRHSEIPRVGHKYTISTKKGSQLVLIFYRSGKREFYFNKAEGDEPELALTINDEEARILGALLLGVDYEADKSSIDSNISDNIVVEWIDLSPNSKLANKSIIDSQIRSETGITIIGIKRGDKVHGSPNITEKLRPNDKLMVTGTEEDIKEFEKICEGE
ncbi:hypothetical protein LJ207_08335 [Halanaerobium sp. Z-7514]|uniref:RCK C-terminal domain-containing protein n=1 Tax=Halanaerobium polyolivorans TaxID=2886943 RepID=A0AAW4X0J7_9FIRM|nr:TrkA C-terminal domain-containing protein [Halanaerobium polyolivorans]MCC3145329.1 hypothetical protein [Halanaerobium polyolivorans]